MSGPGQGRRHPAEAAGGADGPVQIRTIYERFPVTIKGAFVLSGADPDPHSARILEAVVARIPSGPVKPIAIEDGELDVAPKRDLFLPFEASIAELEPGWYTVRSRVRVDGGRVFELSGRPFAVPWPRSSVRTGSVAVDGRIRLGDVEASIERLDMKTDRVEVIWRVERPSTPKEDPGPPRLALRVSADGSELAEVPWPQSSLETGFTAGRRRSVCYPVPRGASELTIEVSGPGRGATGGPVAIRLA